MQQKQQSFIFIGRSGCGKGTQANLLIDLLKKKNPEQKILHVETGKEFRRIALLDNHTAGIVKKTLEGGGLMPEFMCVYAWGTLFFEQFTGLENLIFDGTPRKFLETTLLMDLFPFYNLAKPWVVYLDVEHEELHKRLKLRGRSDDTTEAITKRLEWYESEVKPSVEFFRTSPNVNFLDIDGERSIEEIHADIVKKVGLV